MSEEQNWGCIAEELSPDREWVLKMLRFRPDKVKNPERALREVDIAREEVAKAARPIGTWCRLPQFAVNEDLLTFAGRTIGSEKTARHFVGSQEGILMVVTLGEGIDHLIRDLFAADRYAAATAADVWGSAYAEAAANRLNARLIHELQIDDDTQITPRFSPGYGGWSQEDNCWLLSLGNDIGVSATPAGMLHPQKSITAVIGVK